MSVGGQGIQSGKKAKTGQNRRKSRELALKAVYRGLVNTGELKQVFAEMKDDPEYGKVDETYFRQLLEGVTDKRSALDQQIAVYIDRTLEELSPVEHAILCIASYELMYDPSIPYRVAINEGVELAKLYGGQDGHKYINGVLDKVAEQVRPHEFRK